MTKLLVNVLILTCLIQLAFEDDSGETEDGDGNRAPLSFAFIVLLYNSRDPNRTCPGTVISQWWILDNCEDFPGYEYEYFKNAWVERKQVTVTYKIQERIHREDYKRVDLHNKDIDAELLFAAKNALFLHSSAKEMVLDPEILFPIKLNDRKILPRRGHLVYIYHDIICKKSVKFLPNEVCNDIYKPYFDPGKEIVLDKKFICINSTGITPERCCHSQAFLVIDGIFTGLMSWSTPCLLEVGVTPWVFTNIASYTLWLYNHTNVKNFKALASRIPERGTVQKSVQIIIP